MCTIPPPPPPPLTPDPIEPSKPVQINQLIFSNDLCKWACKYPDLREACIKNNICLNEPPFAYSYKQFESIIQEGPTCGLVALSMLLRGTVSPVEILQLAKAEGFTNNGEMFSCKYMMKLAQKMISLADIEDVKVSLRTKELFSENLIKKLLNGTVLLVPYDADFNHSPSLKKGHKAHWALVAGIIIINKSEAPYTSDPDNVYVLCRHGKSKYVTAWKLDDLNKSNMNLLEFAPRREGDGWIYILPDGGIAGENGLKDQFLAFEGL